MLFYIYSLCYILGILVSAERSFQNNHEIRQFWVKALTTLVQPVIKNAAAGTLKKNIAPSVTFPDRQSVAYMEAFSRTLSGLSSWLELEPSNDKEGILREQYVQLTLKGLRNIAHPNSSDYFDMTLNPQCLVEAAWLSSGLIRSPKLWKKLTKTEQMNIITLLKQSRKYTPYTSNNWVLFGAIVEATIWKYTGVSDNFIWIENGIKYTLKYYVGDGTYGDGEHFHWDYYNSYVIQPFLLEVLKVCVEKNHTLAIHYPTVVTRAKRMAIVEERLVSPEGTYPVLGRTSSCRLGAFQTTASLILSNSMPKLLDLGAVRSALTALIDNVLVNPANTYDKNGWLQPGIIGFQPKMLDPYISTGSDYVTSVVFLPLGLPSHAPFWTVPSAPWSQKLIWSGDTTVSGDHALEHRHVE